MLNNASKPIIGFAAYSGVGKTTLLRAVVPLLRNAGIRVALVKHAHHDFDIDIPGKDSYQLRRAGASPVLVASARRRALIMEHTVALDPELDEELKFLPQDDIDLILVEGFRHEAFAKIELYRSRAGHPPIYPEDEHVIAVATDGELPVASELPRLDINQPVQIAEFILRTYDLA